MYSVNFNMIVNDIEHFLCVYWSSGFLKVPIQVFFLLIRRNF